MFYRSREKMHRWWFDLWCREILLTPPLQPKKSSLKIVSMVSHCDLLMYLVAIKSFYSLINYGQIIIINDGTLSSSDINLLRTHVSPKQIISINDIVCNKTPSNGCWERLLFISDCVEDSYVIQIDSDTITLGDISEVVDSINSGRSFTLGTFMGREILPIREICLRMKSVKINHIQVIAEKNFDKLENYDRLKYIRGSAGFAGFAKGSFSRTDIIEFSTQMEKHLGKIWWNWGSEQVTSNFIIANSGQPFVLPYPKYANFTPELLYDQSVFLHFIGSYRFRKGIYVRKALDIIKILKAGKL
jgi:hypothetical protein